MSAKKAPVAPAPPNPTPPDPARYNAFVAGIQLRRIELAELSARSVPTHLPQAQLRVSQQLGVTCPSREEGRFLAEARLQLGFQTADGQELGMIACTYRLEYASATEVTDELIEEFSRRNVPVNAWPFLRETAMNLTQRFGWTGFVLPPLVLTPAPAKESKAKASKTEKAAGHKAPKAKAPSTKAAAPARKPREAAEKAEG